MLPHSSEGAATSSLVYRQRTPGHKSRMFVRFKNIVYVHLHLTLSQMYRSEISYKGETFFRCCLIDSYFHRQRYYISSIQTTLLYLFFQQSPFFAFSNFKNRLDLNLELLLITTDSLTLKFQGISYERAANESKPFLSSLLI